MSNAINQHHLHVVVKDRVRHSVNLIEKPPIDGDQRLEPFFGGEPDKASAAVSQRLHEI